MPSHQRDIDGVEIEIDKIMLKKRNILKYAKYIAIFFMVTNIFTAAYDVHQALTMINYKAPGGISMISVRILGDFKNMIVAALILLGALYLWQKNDTQNKEIISKGKIYKFAKILSILLILIGLRRGIYREIFDIGRYSFEYFNLIGIFNGFWGIVPGVMILLGIKYQEISNNSTKN